MFSGVYAGNGCSGSGPIMKSVKSIALSEDFLYGYSVRGRRGKDKKKRERKGGKENGGEDEAGAKKSEGKEEGEAEGERKWWGSGGVEGGGVKIRGTVGVPQCE